MYDPLYTQWFSFFLLFTDSNVWRVVLSRVCSASRLDFKLVISSWLCLDNRCSSNSWSGNTTVVNVHVNGKPNKTYHSDESIRLYSITWQPIRNTVGIIMHRSALIVHGNTLEGLTERLVISRNQYQVFHNFEKHDFKVLYPMRTMYVVPMERAWKDYSNHTKYSKSPEIYLHVF